MPNKIYNQEVDYDFHSIYMENGTGIDSLNLFQTCFLDNKKDTWHLPRKNTQHISPLSICPKKAAIDIICKPIHSTTTEAVFYIGNEYIHKDVQEKYIKRFPYTVAELIVRIIVKIDKSTKFELVGKIDLADFFNSRLIDIKSIASYALKWVKSGSSKNPIGAKKAHLIQTLVYWYIWNFIVIKETSNFYWLDEAAILYVNKDNYEDVYCKIPLQKFDPLWVFNQTVEYSKMVHIALKNGEWEQLNENCIYDPKDSVCKSYCQESENCKQRLNPEENPMYAHREHLIYNGGKL